MKITFVIPSLWFGGAERVVSVLANELVNTNEVNIVLTSNNTDIAYDLDGRISIHTCNEKSILKTWLCVRKICKKTRPDIVVAFMSGCGIMSSLCLIGTGIPVIVSERNDPKKDRASLSSLIRFLGKISPIVTTGYVFQSEGAKSYYSRYIQEKSRIILNPLNVDDLPNREIDKIDNRIVTVGRLCPQKNQKMLIEAFAKSQAKEGHTLHIYGDGPLRDEFESLINALGMKEKIFLEGNSRHVHEDIKNSKLFVFTSDYEGLPNALMEALAMGIPCVSTDCSPGGARMLIEDGVNGVIVPCGDVDRLSVEIDNLCNNSDKLLEFSEKSKTIRDNTRIEVIADKWMDFLNLCLKQKR